jgi:hypothetical protein
MKELKKKKESTRQSVSEQQGIGQLRSVQNAPLLNIPIVCATYFWKSS